jgi:hypothetical protein
MEESFKGWPPCDRCGKPVNKRSGVLSIRPEWWASWLWSHGKCRPRRNLYWIEAERFDTLDKVLAWTLHLSEKMWFRASNWRETVKRFYNVPGA